MCRDGIDKTRKKLQEKLRTKGFKQVKKYSWEKMAQETLLIYNKVVKNK